MFFVFRAVITEEFKVPDKMVGFSKYPVDALPLVPVCYFILLLVCLTCSRMLLHTVL